MTPSTTVISDTINALQATLNSFIRETHPDSKRMFFTVCTEYLGSLLAYPGAELLLRGDELRLVHTALHQLHEYSYTVSE
jgi:hypothetical protein